MLSRPAQPRCSASAELSEENDASRETGPRSGLGQRVGVADVLMADRTWMGSIALDHPGQTRSGPTRRNAIHVLDDVQRVSDVVSTEIEAVGIDRMIRVDLVTIHRLHGICTTKAGRDRCVANVIARGE